MSARDSRNIDCLIVGGGAVGLALAYELSKRGESITLLDRSLPGREASWAGAGILPPANRRTALHPTEKLRAVSHELHAQWAAELREATGIDTGYERCGGIYFARSLGEAAALHAQAAAFREEEIACNRLTPTELCELEPATADMIQRGLIRAAYRLEDECQLRNPHYLQALLAACEQNGVTIVPHCEVTEFRSVGDRITAVMTAQGEFAADRFAITAGPWTRKLLADMATETGILPIRGQIVLFHARERFFRHIFNEGPRYLVPRTDGRVLVGSSEEEAGFEKRTTPEVLRELTEFARDLFPKLRAVEIENSWAGLRPASYDGFPYIGKLPQFTNAFAAAGHFRSGLHLSPGTAVLLAQLMHGETPFLDPAPFRVGRG